MLDPQPPSLDAAQHLAALFRERVRCTPDAIAYRDYDCRQGRWVDTTWRAAAAEVGRWQAALARDGLRPGDRVAVQVRNSPEWVFFEQAALGLGLVVVPLYPDDRPENTLYILRDCGARLLLVQDGACWRRLAPHLAELPGLSRVVVLHGRERPAERDGAVSANAWLPSGEFSVQTEELTGDRLATVVYTSGTTGSPKGVMLSHGNILSNVRASAALERFGENDCFLSFLPLSHMLERTGGYYLPMLAGATVAFARSIQQLADDMQAIRPTVMIAVPRVFERVYARIQAQLSQRSHLARSLFALTVRVGWSRFLTRQSGRTAPGAALLWPLLDALVARRVAARLGGRLRFAVSGGAALPAAVARFFHGLGVDVLQGYGLTEMSPVVSVNTPQDNDPASIGRALKGVEICLGEEDELLVRGPNLMMGYWNNEAATRQILTADGWLRTGDQARLHDGRLYITGRLKDILVLSNGEKVAPADLESAITLDPLFDHAIVLGEGRPYLAALLAVNRERWEIFGRDHGFDPTDSRRMEDAAVQRLVLSRLGRCLHGFPGYAKIRRVALTEETWTVESGLLTPTLKLRRHQVLRRYRHQLDSLYEARGAGT